MNEKLNMLRINKQKFSWTKKDSIKFAISVNGNKFSPPPENAKEMTQL